MMKNSFILFAVLLLAGCGATEVVDRATDGQVRLIRSPQPSESDLEQLHKQYSLCTIINLRGFDVKEAQREGEELPTWHLMEEAFAKKHGITYLYMDLNDGTKPPSEEDIALFLHLANSEAFWPILIHCQAGIHRTGFFAALYRIQFNGWDAERAISEMEDHYFNWSISDRSAIKQYLRDYKVRKLN